MPMESGARGEDKVDEREMMSEMRDGRLLRNQPPFSRRRSFISPIAVTA
jgi:hypothetical protein